MDPEQALGDPRPERRLEALSRLAEALRTGSLRRPSAGEEVNNHIHTIYSFSPYSPAEAVWRSVIAGLATAGIMDHDTISGAAEFIAAGRQIGLATTIGVECRCGFSGTPLAGRRINNPDQLSVAYVALHGIPHGQIEAVREYFRPLQQARNERNRRMVDRLNAHLGRRELTLDFEADVVSLSRSSEQGTITERHILFALARRMIERFGRGRRLVDFLEHELGLKPTARVRSCLLDEANPHYAYDLLGALKSDLVPAFYIDAGPECPEVGELLAFSRRIGAIAAYAYLGDVTESVTGDKKAQRFEDGYLEELFDIITALGFQAVTYMPNRNTFEQLERVQALCRRHSLFQISGVDINSPRQSFTCPELRLPQFRHLITATWALIGHELEATEDPERGMFSPRSVRRCPSLEERIAAFAELGRMRCGSGDVRPAGKPAG